MNVFLHNIDNARIEWGDTIRNPKLIEDDSFMKYNIVVANPPFSLDKWCLQSSLRGATQLVTIFHQKNSLKINIIVY